MWLALNQLVKKNTWKYINSYVLLLIVFVCKRYSYILNKMTKVLMILIMFVCVFLYFSKQSYKDIDVVFKMLQWWGRKIIRRLWCTIYRGIKIPCCLGGTGKKKKKKDYGSKQAVDENNTAIFLTNGLRIVYCSLLQCLTLVYLGWGQKSFFFLAPSNYT